MNHRPHARALSRTLAKKILTNMTISSRGLRDQRPANRFAAKTRARARRGQNALKPAWPTQSTIHDTEENEKLAPSLALMLAMVIFILARSWTTLAFGGAELVELRLVEGG